MDGAPSLSSTAKPPTSQYGADISELGVKVPPTLPHSTLQSQAHTPELFQLIMSVWNKLLWTCPN